MDTPQAKRLRIPVKSDQHTLEFLASDDPDAEVVARIQVSREWLAIMYMVIANSLEKTAPSTSSSKPAS